MNSFVSSIVSWAHRRRAIVASPSSGSSSGSTSGLGVDGGVHLVHRHQERRDALQATAELAPVILIAAAITLLGCGTLISSSFPTLQSMGLVSIVSTVTVAAASVLLLPALLLTRSPR